MKAVLTFSRFPRDMPVLSARSPSFFRGAQPSTRRRRRTDMTRRRFEALVVGGLLVALASCTASSRVSAAQPARPAPATRPSPTTPPIIGSVSACGGAALRLVADGRSLQLLDCAGWAGLNPLPAVRIRVGETVTVANGDIKRPPDPQQRRSRDLGTRPSSDRRTGGGRDGDRGWVAVRACCRHSTDHVPTPAGRCRQLNRH